MGLDEHVSDGAFLIHVIAVVEVVEAAHGELEVQIRGAFGRTVDGAFAMELHGEAQSEAGGRAVEGQLLLDVETLIVWRKSIQFLGSAERGACYSS